MYPRLIRRRVERRTWSLVIAGGIYGAVKTISLKLLYPNSARRAWRLLITEIIYIPGYRNTCLSWYQPATLSAASERNPMEAEVSSKVKAERAIYHETR